jgi:hypothetical protein
MRAHDAVDEDPAALLERAHGALGARPEETPFIVDLETESA